MKNLAVIPARGGSVGIPKKNLKFFCGEPLITRIVNIAILCPCIDRVVVSTDDREIQKIAIRAGAEAPFLMPQQISGSESSSEMAILHAVEWLRANEAVVPERLTFLQATNPFTNQDDISRAHEMLEAANFDVIFGAARSHSFVWQIKEGSAVGVNHNCNYMPMRQMLAPQYEENGSLYIMKSDNFLNAKHRFFGRIGVFRMPKWTSLELDDEIDWEMAEAVFASISKKLTI